jgi:hypothetical protein
MADAEADHGGIRVSASINQETKERMEAWIDSVAHLGLRKSLSRACYELVLIGLNAEAEKGRGIPPKIRD